jgi:ubiquinone/menaquinone biosynthesis C-methylase UbiE
MGPLREYFGDIDIYLFDQLLKGTYDHCHKVIDVGCGAGRNLPYFLKNGYDVYAVDPDVAAIELVRDMAAGMAPKLPETNFVAARAEEMLFPDRSFDLVICSAVLHFARNAEHFERMLRGAWRILKPGGYFFARLASDIGIETYVVDKGNGRYQLPDGTTRYLVNHDTISKFTNALGGELHEPIKTTNVHNIRCMTTWCMRRKS